MNTGKVNDIPARLEGVCRRFERWRERLTTGRSRIPNSLWAAAVRMAEAYGISRTAKALRLSYYSLKERVEQQSMATSEPATTAAANTFVELASAADHGFAAVPVGRCECTLELEDVGGAKMRVHWKSVEMPDLAALSRSFWNPAS